VPDDVEIGLGRLHLQFVMESRKENRPSIGPRADEGAIEDVT
jgi:hypothetical protein